MDLAKYPEPAIDAMRAQKDEELEKIRRTSERKTKENIVSSIMSKDKRKGKAYSRARAAQMASE